MWCVTITLADIKTVAEIIAFVSGAWFFFWKLRSGYLIVNLRVSIGSERSYASAETDHLAVSAKLTKGAIGTLILHDARVRVSYPGGWIVRELVGYERLTFRDDPHERTRSRVVFGHRSLAAPYLFLTPDEEVTFSALAEVPASLPCVIELAVSGRRRYRDRVGQWRSSIISLPRSTRFTESTGAQLGTAGTKPL
jgi:hypothetical protein